MKRRHVLIFFLNEIKLPETHQEHKHILSEKETKVAHQLNENNQITKVLLFHKGKFHKGIKNLLRTNIHTQDKNTTKLNESNHSSV